MGVGTFTWGYELLTHGQLAAHLGSCQVKFVMASEPLSAQKEFPSGVPEKSCSINGTEAQENDEHMGHDLKFG